MYTAITVTGDRPEAFMLCCKYLCRQTITPKEWLVCDDGNIPIKNCLDLWKNDFQRNQIAVTYIRRKQQEWEPVSSMNRNLLKLLPLIQTEKIIIFEDDDYYKPEHSSVLLPALDNYQYTGQAQTYYYHLENKSWRRLQNKHPSFCQSAFTKSAIPEITKLCRNWKDPFLDINIWKTADLIKQTIFFDPPTMIGIKRMPGRKSQTSGHIGRGFHSDEKLEKFNELLGSDADYYLQYMI